MYINNSEMDKLQLMGFYTSITTSQTSHDELSALGTTEGDVTEVAAVNQPLIIIIWAVGGVLLVILLAILGRMVLSKRKYTSDDPDCLDNRRFFQPTTLRIMVDSGGPTTHAPSNNGCTSPGFAVPYSNNSDCHSATVGNQSSANTNFVHQNPTCQPGVPTTDRNVPQDDHTNCVQASRSLDTLNDRPICSQTSVSLTTLNGRPNCSQTSGSLTTLSGRTGSLQTPGSLTTLNGRTNSLQTAGSLATLNGVILSPPPYEQVVNTDTRLPSVVVGRYQRETTPNVPPRINQNASPRTNQNVSPRTTQNASLRTTHIAPSRTHATTSHAISSGDISNINTRISSALVGRSNQGPQRPLPKPRMLFSL